VASVSGAPGFVPEELREEVGVKLRRQLEYVAGCSAFYNRRFGEHGVGPSDVAGPGDLARLPLTTKQMLRDSQAAAPPLGEHAAVAMSEVIRVHASTGTTGTPSWIGVTASDAEGWTQLVAEAMRTQGLTRDDVVVHGAGLTLFVGGLPVRDGIERVGATFVPIGTGASERAVQAMSSLGVTTLHSTPSYARYLAEYVRTRAGRDPRELGLRKIMVGGEPGGGEPAFRAQLEEEWGATVTEGLGNADMAPIIFAEAPGTAGMRLSAPHHVLVELVDPDTTEPIEPEPGTTGELVYTSLDRQCCPLVRFQTRDRVRVTGLDSRDRPLIRCIGRTDDMLIVLGVNVFPSALRDLVQSFAPRTTGVMQAVLPVPGPRVEPPLVLEVEEGPAPGDPEDLARRLEETIRGRLSVSTRVSLVPLGSLERSEMKSTLARVARVG
jgi:phenylacetate-CoA ligase